MPNNHKVLVPLDGVGFNLPFGSEKRLIFSHFHARSQKTGVKKKKKENKLKARTLDNVSDEPLFNFKILTKVDFWINETTVGNQPVTTTVGSKS